MRSDLDLETVVSWGHWSRGRKRETFVWKKDSDATTSHVCNTWPVYCVSGVFWT